MLIDRSDMEHCKNQTFFVIKNRNNKKKSCTVQNVLGWCRTFFLEKKIFKTQIIKEKFFFSQKNLIYCFLQK